MNGAGKARLSGRLKRRALSLGALKSFDHALRFLLPVVLVRCFDTATFGEYRLLWLAVGTVMLVASLNMSGSLYFFVPRSEPRRKRLYIHQTMLYLAVSGLVCGFAVSVWNPLLPAAIGPLGQYGALVPAFVALWVAGLLLDHLPAVDERIAWQAYATIGASALRALLVGLGAWFSGDLRVVLWLLVAAGGVKLALLLVYVARHHGLAPPWLERAAFVEQFSHAAPLGISQALSTLRVQADQWVAAILFSLSSFAAFSIAAVVSQLVGIFRHSVMEALLPSMSRMQAAGDVPGMMDMNSRGNVMVGALLFPLLAFAFVFAEDIVTLVYTASYIEAVPAMRVYVLGIVPMVIEMGSIVMLLRQGPFQVRVAALVLVVSVAASWGAAHHVGLAGAAAGSVLGVYLDRVLMLRRISLATGIALRRLQDWRSLASTLAFAALSAALAGGIVNRFFAGSGPLVHLVAGGAVLALVYAAAHCGRRAQALQKEA